MIPRTTRAFRCLPWLVAILLAACTPPKPQPTTDAPPTRTTTIAPDAVTATREASPGDPATDPPSSEPVSISVFLGYPPQTLDPGTVTPMDASAHDLIANLFVGLAVLDPETGLVEPALAQTWDRSGDGLTWTVTLRDDIPWMRLNPDTGTQEAVRLVNSGDVLAAVARACSPHSAAPLVGSLFLIRGCRDVYSLPAQDVTPDLVESTLGVRVVNDTTVEFKLVRDSALFPSLIAMPILYPVPSELLESAGTAWVDPAQMWSSGPFMLDPASAPGTEYHLLANPQWPIERTGNLAEVHVTVSDLPQLAYDRWLDGTLAMTTIPPTAISGTPFGEDPRFVLQARPATAMLAFSYDTPPMQAEKLRWALAYAIDRQLLIDTVLEPSGTAGLPAYGVVPPGMAAAPAYGTGVSFDPEAAREALREAGYSNCGGMQQITLLVDADSDLSLALADGIVSMWKANLGCGDHQFIIERLPLQDVEYFLHEPPTPIQRQFRPLRAQVAMLHWQADYPDAHHWLADVVGCRELFPRAYLNASRDCVGADETLAQAEKNQQITARRELYAQTEDGYFGPNGAMPVVPLFFYARPLAFQPWLEYYPVHAGPLRFDYWIATP